MDSKTFLLDLVKGAAIHITQTPYVLMTIALGLGLALAAKIFGGKK